MYIVSKMFTSPCVQPMFDTTHKWALSTLFYDLEKLTPVHHEPSDLIKGGQLQASNLWKVL